MDSQKFEELNLSTEMLDAIRDMGFEEATPIQVQSIKIIGEGFDVVGQSQTGTGKTAAFGIPSLEKIDENSRKLQLLVLCPTRELAVQVCEEFRKLLKYKSGVKVVPVYGGQPIDRQIMALKKGVQVVVGTPGRVMDHMRRKTIKLSDVNTIVLDEADEMLDMGFREDIEFVLADLPEERQVILFSATMSKVIMDITKTFQRDPKYIKIERSQLTVPNIEQYYMELRENTKIEALCRLVDLKNPKLSIIFCNTKKRVDEVVESLQSRGYFAEGLHGDLKQMQRDVVMKKFRNKTLEMLVATDVAARGIDVENVDMVFNLDLPQDPEYYVHRIGRTGRAGKSGVSYSFIVGREIYKLKDIMRYTGANIVRQAPPSLADVQEVKVNTFLSKIEETIEAGDLDKYTHLVDKLSNDGYSSYDIAAALLKLQLHNDSKADEIEIDLTYDRNSKKGRDGGRDGREGRGSRERGERDKKREAMPKGTRLFMNVGRRDKVSVKDIVGCIANEADISSKNIGAIDIYDEFTFVDIADKYVNQVIDKLNGIKVRKRTVNIEKAKKSRK